MKLLLDQGLPRSTVVHLHSAGLKRFTWETKGWPPQAIRKFLTSAARKVWSWLHWMLDFHALLALSGAKGPSVIRIRIEGLRAEKLSLLLLNVLQICRADLLTGAMVSVTESGARVRRLPVLR